MNEISSQILTLKTPATALPNIGVVEHGVSDVITITLLGRVYPHGLVQVHEFNGKGLAEIRQIFLGYGVDIVAWLVDSLPGDGREFDGVVPLIVKSCK